MVIKRAPFVNKPFSGYFHTQIPEDDKEITRCGPGTPAGEYLRRFWQPVLVTHQLEETPFALTRFCEELVCSRYPPTRKGALCAHEIW
jgi:hypothetical protein